MTAHNASHSSKAAPDDHVRSFFTPFLSEDDGDSTSCGGAYERLTTEANMHASFSALLAHLYQLRLCLVVR